jgi:adenosylcobyric acid synthase
VAGFIINRFRGDIRLFEEGVRWIEARTGKPVFGVLPWYAHFTIAPEDAVVIEQPAAVSPDRLSRPAIAVVRIPHISNFTDFQPLEGAGGVDLCFIEKPVKLDGFAAVVLPGSKNTRYDLAWAKQIGWDRALHAYAEGGGHLLGVCGGYQMMGRVVHDPHGLEGPPGSEPGLDLLPVETTLQAPKTTTLSQFQWEGISGTGYEIHMGHTRRAGCAPLFSVTARNGQPPGSEGGETEDGCISPSGRIMATYMHGLFDTPAILGNWFARIGLHHATPPRTTGPEARDRDYDLLCDHFAAHVQTERLLKLIHRNT